jgi:hypothetical protein
VHRHRGTGKSIDGELTEAAAPEELRVDVDRGRSPARGHAVEASAIGARSCREVRGLGRLFMVIVDDVRRVPGWPCADHGLAAVEHLE